MRNIFAARRVLRPATALSLLVLANGCSSDLLSVDTPDVISQSAIGGSVGATTLRNGSIQDFIVGLSGSGDGFVVATGNMTDEVQTSDTFADRYNTDQRLQTEILGGALNTTYQNLQLARAGITSAIEAWTTAKVNPTATVRDTLAEMYALRGLTETYFAEAYCAGVPFSKVNSDGTFAYGDPLTTTQMLTVAGATLDSSTALSTAANIKNLAAVGKARVLVNLGQFAQAAAAVTAVPTTFRYQVFHSAATGRQNNGIFNSLSPAGSRYTAGTREGTNGLDFLSTPADPRVPWQASTRTGFDGTSRNMPVQLKYPAVGSAVTVADGIEARLIEAEAALNSAGTGGSQTARDQMTVILNTARSTGGVAGLAALTPPVTQNDAVDLLFRERAYWMWLTGHRLGDMRRLIRQYGRAANTVFPVGPMLYRPGNSYSNDVNFVVPVRERNNPKFNGCINRNP